MDAPLHGRHALVTGAGRGIGAAIAARLLAEGARVTLLSRTQSQLDQVAAALGSRARTACADITDLQATRRVFEQAALAFGAGRRADQQCGPAHKAPHAAGHPRSFGTPCSPSTSPEPITAFAPCCPPCWNAISAASSTWRAPAGVRGYPYVAAYCAAKHGVIGLTRALALEVARQNITVNAVCPGYTDTDLVQESIANIQRATGRSRRAGTRGALPRPIRRAGSCNRRSRQRGRMAVPAGQRSHHRPEHRGRRRRGDVAMR